MPGAEKVVTEVSKAFAGILKRASTPATFKTWLEEKLLFQPMDLVLLAMDENQIEKKILLPCKSTVMDVAELVVEVSIRKAWMYCKESMQHKDTVEKKELDPSEAGTLAAAWDGRYGVKLSTSERVGRQLMRRLYNMAHSEPPDFEIVLLEQITVYSSCPKSVQQVVKGGDNQLMMQVMQVEAVNSVHVAIDGIRALLFSFV